MPPIRILLLEDSKLDAELTARTLANAGLDCALTQVADQPAFVAAVREGEFDLILADYALPDYDGQLALEMVRRLDPDIPFIFVSGVLGEEVAIDSLRQGATDYVLKHRLERLGPAVRRALTEQTERETRRVAEQALRESELRYRLLVENVKEYALVMTDREGRVTLWNQGAERLFGHTERAVLGEAISDLEIPQLTHDLLGDAGDLSEGVKRYEGWLPRRDRTLFWASATSTWIYSAAGSLQSVVTIIRDNTERKQAETERSALLERERSARADAEQQARDLKEANAALARSNAELEQFAYAASHDLQEPLRMIKSFTQMLSLHCKDRLDANAQEMLRFIETGSTRMQKLVDDLLSYSRILHTREQSKGRADLEHILDQTLLLFKEQLDTLDVQILRTPLPRVAGNGDRLGLVFQNLISNALKYHDGGPIRIEVSGKRVNGNWQIEVSDNGIGFAPQYAEQIFGLFKRLHRAEEYAGTGVGLALCKQIVEQHGGRIWAESEKGRGAKFVFTLPAGERA